VIQKVIFFLSYPKVILTKSTLKSSENLVILKKNKSLAFSTWLFPLGKSTEPMNILQNGSSRYVWTWASMGID